MSKTYNQLTSPLIYKGVSLKKSGCGACAVASIAYNIKTSNTLKKVFEYMVDKGYMRVDGSIPDGITKTLEYFGFKVSYFNCYNSDVNTRAFFDALKKSSKDDYWAVALMHGKEASWCEGKSNKWTKHGHYISITYYDAFNKMYYVRDSANGMTGYHAKSEFVGDIVSGWVVTRK